MSRDGWSIKSRKAKRMPLPAWYMEGEPPLYFPEAIFIEAFWELCADRQFGYAVGPIPWSSIRLYARDLRLNRRVSKMFHLIIRELDAEYDRYNKNKQNKRIQADEAADKQKAKDKKDATL